MASDEIMESTLTPPEQVVNTAANLERSELSTSSGNLTLTQFFDLMYYTLQVEQPDLIFTPSFPNYLIPGTDENQRTMDSPTQTFKDTVTYKVTQEEPGTWGGDNEPFGDRRELTPRFREEIVENHESIQVFGQMFDTLVQFDVWSLTNYEVERMALWFKRFMTKYRKYFKDMGLSEMLFWWRGEDDVTRELKNSLHFRSLVYFIRTEEITTSKDVVLEQMKIDIEQKF
jgi:hypothetical protein